MKQHYVSRIVTIECPNVLCDEFRCSTTKTAMPDSSDVVIGPGVRAHEFEVVPCLIQHLPQWIVIRGEGISSLCKRITKTHDGVMIALFR